jgi:toxin CcdB
MMGQFDVHKNPRRGEFPLLLDVQSELLSRLATRVVVPMARLKRWDSKPITRLNPIARIGGVEYILVFQELAAIAGEDLGERVTSLAGRRAELLGALDLLIMGI